MKDCMVNLTYVSQSLARQKFDFDLFSGYYVVPYYPTMEYDNK